MSAPFGALRMIELKLHCLIDFSIKRHWMNEVGGRLRAMCAGHPIRDKPGERAHRVIIGWACMQPPDIPCSHRTGSSYYRADSWPRAALESWGRVVDPFA